MEGKAPGPQGGEGQELILPPPRVRSPCTTGPLDLPPREELTAEYHRLVAELNRKNAGLLWWAGPLASKNPFDSPLYESLVRYDALLDAIRRRPAGAGRARVAGGDPLIAGELARACAEYGADCEKPGSPTLRALRHACLGIVHSAYFVLVNLWRKALIHIYLGNIPGRLTRDRTPAYVIRSWLDHRSFDTAGNYRDAYFGRLPGFIAGSRRLVVVAGIVWTCPYRAALKKIRAQYPRVPVIPQEYFLTVRDILRAALLPFSGARPDTGDVVFHGREVGDIVAEAASADRASLQVRSNLGFCYAARRIASLLPVSHFTYSFENHAFEKMMVLGLREASPQTVITGYQHGGVSRMLHNYFLAEGEARAIPLPDRILTTGDEPRRVLVGEGHFPPGLVETGCALRYEDLQGVPARLRGKGGSIFVPLPVDAEAARSVVDLVVQVVGDLPEYLVRLKSHPLIPREAILGPAGTRRLPANIAWGEGTTRELLAVSDIVLYTQTTTCIEALMLGIPVVYLDLFTMYDADYILGDIPFRWVADDPESLARALLEIQGLGGAEYAARQKAGIDYGRSFFAPVTDDSLRKFLSPVKGGPVT